MKNCKVYSDGGHYIAIRKTEGHSGPRNKPLPEEPIVIEEELQSQTEEQSSFNDKLADPEETTAQEEDVLPELGDDDLIPKSELRPKKQRISTRSDEFLKWYRESYGMRYQVQRSFIASKLAPYFSNKIELNQFIDRKITCKKRAEITRRIRCMRRAALHELSYFCTFTYDDKKATEKEFQKRLLVALSNLACRKKWKYMGTWERGGDTDRLHFHAIMYIPEGKMIGKLENKRDYDVKKTRMVDYVENSFFKDRFGRNTFQVIDGTALSLGKAVSYLVKYIDKQGGRIICSKGLRTFIETDIDNKDIITRLRDDDDKKYVLFDDFKVYKDGKELGEMSPSVLECAKTVN